MQCLLKGSEQYCETGRGICCASCREREDCDNLNAPSRCGYAAEEPACRMVPAPRPRKTWR